MYIPCEASSWTLLHQNLTNFFAEPTVLLVRITSCDVQICFYPEKSYFFLNNEKKVRSLNNKIVYDVMYRVNFAISVNSNSGNRYFYWFYAKTRRLYVCWYWEFLINWYIFKKNLGYGYYWTKAPVTDIYFHVRAE